jgi:hypothetical protein
MEYEPYIAVATTVFQKKGASISQPIAEVSQKITDARQAQLIAAALNDAYAQGYKQACCEVVIHVGKKYKV